MESKNYGLKIPVRACMCTRVCVYACMIEEIEHTTKTGIPTEHRTTGKGRNTGKAEKPEYICMIAGNEKKYKKKVKKNL